jgi:hypothetical protein
MNQITHIQEQIQKLKQELTYKPLDVVEKIDSLLMQPQANIITVSLLEIKQSAHIVL